MMSYLLLRNNKESGPFSLEQLVSMGLKAYDLIWVNGKSAAWRYPGEIPELVQYAPAVEEQPYDRFYKRSTDEAKSDVVPQQKAQEPIKPAAIKETQTSSVRPTVQPQEEIQAQPVENEAVKAAPLNSTKPIEEVKPTINELAARQQAKIATEKSFEQSDYLPQEQSSPAPQAFEPKKSVFVTLPKNPVYSQPVQQPAQQPNPSYYSQPNTQSSVAAEPAPTISITENPVAAEIKYSQPLDEIKEMYVKTLQERKQRMANKVFVLQTIKKAAVVVAIIGAGIVIGMALKSGDGKKLVAGTELQSNVLVPQQDITDPSLNKEVDVPIVNNDQESAETQQFNNPVTETKSQPASVYREPAVQKSQEDKRLLSNTNSERVFIPEPVVPAQQEKKPVIEEPSPGVEVNERTGERIKKVRTGNDEEITSSRESREEKVEKPTTRSAPAPKNSSEYKSLASLVSVKSNDYKIVAFGGIRDLQLSVFNESQYALDKVLVELQYLKPNQEPFRIDIITFKSVSPGGSLTIRMPDTNRGIKVRYRITNILSTQASKDL